MLNKIILCGRIASDLDNIENNTIIVAVPRQYKNGEGIYETDMIPVMLFGNAIENTSKYCKKGDICGVNGRIELRDNKLVVICEKLSFLSSKKED